MAYTKVVGRVLIGDPAHDGLTTKWGFGRDWPASETRETLAGGQVSADVTAEYAWYYRSLTGGCFEYRKELQVIKPAGSFTEVSMALASWAILGGQWQETPISGALRYKWLHFYDGRPNRAGLDVGKLQTTGAYWPDLRFRLLRFQADPAETQLACINIILHGDGIVPELLLSIPDVGQSGSYWQGYTGEAAAWVNQICLYARMPGATQWTFVDSLVEGPGRRGQYALATPEYVTIEYIDRWLSIKIEDFDPWVVGGKWRDAAYTDHELVAAAGKVTVEVIGQTAMFQMVQASYSPTYTLYPAVWAVVNANIATTPVYRLVGSVPPGTSLTVAPQYQGAYVSQPVVTFNCTATRAPVLQNVQEYRSPTIGAIVAGETSTQARATLKLKRMRGTLTSKWKGAFLEAEVEAATGSDIDALIANDWVQAQVSLNNGDTYYYQFTGYGVPLEKSLDPQRAGKQQGVLRAYDGPKSRLEHKTMFQHCSYGGWPIDLAAREILGRSGVPNSLISIDANISLAAMGSRYYLPILAVGKPNPLAFRPNESPVAALDMICGLRDLEWGQNEQGMYFLAPRLSHVAGTFDLLLDGDSTTDTDILTAFRATHAVEDFWNVLVVLIGQGQGMQARWIADYASINNSSSKHYVGDDWWRLEIHPESDDLQVIVDRLWAKRLELSRMLFYRTQHYCSLLPDDKLKVQVDDVDIPTDSIYRIIEKSWECDPARGRYEQELTAVIIEEGA